MGKKPTVLMILDGYGENPKCEHNAVCEARTPVMDQLKKECPYVQGQASGHYVGLPDGQMGNSEVGHMNMGAGRIVYQDLTRITKSVEDGDFFRNEELLAAVNNAKKNNGALHLWGLLSDGGVHSHITHLYALLELAKREHFSNVFVHCFLDGRDTPPTSGKNYIQQLQDKMKEIGVGRIGVISGRYYAMDRDTNWDRVAEILDLPESEDKEEGYDAESIQQQLSFESMAAFSPDRLLLAILSDYFEDWHLSVHSWDGRYQRNESLECWYDTLTKLGYSMSTDEQQLLNGTHECFKEEEE